MKRDKLLLVFCIFQIFLSTQLAEGDGSNTLPWELIIKQFSENTLLRRIISQNEKGENENNITYDSVLRPIVNLNLPKNQASVLREYKESELFLLNKEEWIAFPNSGVTIDNDLLKISNLKQEGFYCLTAKGKEEQKDKLYFIVKEDWKKDLIAFCIKRKFNIESNPDVQLIKSCIVASHYENVVRHVQRSNILSYSILHELEDAIDSETHYKRDEFPRFGKGIYKIRLKRFRGAQLTEFSIHIPDGDASERKWPIILLPDPRRVGMSSDYPESKGYIKIWWHFPYDTGEYEWEDYRYIINLLRNQFNIDGNRIYISGDCGNGIACMSLALKHPSQWAECSVSLGYRNIHLAGNSYNLPMIYVQGGHPEENLIGMYHFGVKCFERYDSPFLKASLTSNIAVVRGELLPNAILNNYPSRIIFSSDSFEESKAYWVKINGRIDENYISHIDISFKEDKIYLTTDNIDAYTLNLTDELIDDKEIDVIENGINLGNVKNTIFTRKANKYDNAKYIKNEVIHGPIWDAFVDPYILVYPKIKDDLNYTKLCKEIAGKFNKEAILISDDQLTTELIEEYNVIFIGKSSTNPFMSQILQSISIEVEENKIEINKMQFTQSDLGFMLIHPNPLNPKKYISVFGANSLKSLEMIHPAYEMLRSKRDCDVGVFHVNDNDSVIWHIYEKFNTTWNWHEKWSKKIYKIANKYPDWKWRQWLADIIRKQLRVDVVLSNLICTLPITGSSYRDLCNNFPNEWIVTIQISGKDLKKLIMLDNIDTIRKNTIPMAISGVSAFKKNNLSEVIALHELENSKNYKVAIPYRTIIDFDLKNNLQNYSYEIIFDNYLIPILDKYLFLGKIIDLDDELEKVELNII